MNDQERDILKEIIGMIENIFDRLRALEKASQKWPPEGEICMNCGQWLGGPVSCCADPASKEQSNA